MLCSSKFFFKEGRMPQNADHILVTLIPKVKSVLSMRDLHPIGLCNVIYKIISKILTSRLQQIMDDIIREEQSAFLKGRFVSNNILINHEIMHILKQREKRSKLGNDKYYKL